MTQTGDEELLWVLAADHRASFRTTFLGLDRAPTAPETALIRNLKGLIFEGLLCAVDRGLPGGTPAILMDADYGGKVIADARRHSLTTVVPVEASGERELRFEHGDDGVAEAIETIDPSIVKVLIRYHPGDDDRSRATQRERLHRLQDHVASARRRWMLELLVPPPNGQPPEPDTLRMERTTEAVHELAGDDLRPDLWKLEGLPTTQAFADVVSATASGRCLVLGRGEEAEAVERWLRLAAPVAAFTGFADGRTIWWDPLRSHLDHGTPPSVVAADIADRFRRLVDTYLEARSTAQSQTLRSR